MSNWTTQNRSRKRRITLIKAYNKMVSNDGKNDAQGRGKESPQSITHSCSLHVTVIWRLKPPTEGVGMLMIIEYDDFHLRGSVSMACWALGEYANTAPSTTRDTSDLGFFAHQRRRSKQIFSWHGLFRPEIPFRVALASAPNIGTASRYLEQFDLVIKSDQGHDMRWLNYDEKSDW